LLKHEKKVEQQLASLGIQPHQVHEAARRLFDAASNRIPRPQQVVKPTQAETPTETTAIESKGSLEDQAHILQAIENLGRDPRLGGFVSMLDLRRAVERQLPDYDRFDRALLDLARSRRVDLYPHDFPGSLTREERRQLDTDERGRCFNGVSLRQGVETP
jgi:hypothetical protein